MIAQNCVAPAEEGGDCWRACLASILGMDGLDIPNFAHLYPEYDLMMAEARKWLATKGLSMFQTYCSAGWSIDKLLECFSADNPGVPIIVCGQSGRTSNENHAVVAMDGKVIHDPSGCGITGPCVGEGGESGWWWLQVICGFGNVDQ
jgi:hypothetical protein